MCVREGEGEGEGVCVRVGVGEAACARACMQLCVQRGEATHPYRTGTGAAYQGKLHACVQS